MTRLISILIFVVAPALFAQDTIAIAPLTLGAAARLAAKQNAGPLAAYQRTQQAHARVGESRAALLPFVEGRGTPQSERTYNTAPLFGFNFELNGKSLFPPTGVIIGPAHDITYEAVAADTLFSFGAIARIRATKASEKAAEADASDQADSAANAAAATYVRTQAAEALVGARFADSALAADLLSIATDQLKAGTGIALDVTRAQSQLATVRAQLIQARNDYDRARLDLLRSLGLPLSAQVTLSDSLSRLPFLDTLPPEGSAIEDAIRRRRDLRTADLRLDAAEKQISAIRDERLPSFSVAGAYAADGTRYENLLRTYNWALQVSMPIFDGLGRESRLEEQHAAVREIEVRRRDLRQKIAIQVRQAYLDLASARQQVDAARERLRLAQQEVDQARDRFRAGVAGNADVITASLDLDSARTAEINALQLYHSARVALANASGAVQDLP
ncbi:MAG TPA: TolC family protein [Gemmatimonadaceae bacterium]|nr:TolC family protein [Gemmatimonadaceae bacterium]